MEKGQSKWMSLVEAGANTVIGMVVAYVAQLIILPLHGIHVTHGQNLSIMLWFTVVSILRSYMLRRYFNGK